MQTLMAISVERSVQEKPHKEVVQTVN